MATSASASAARMARIALQRFGLGAKPGGWRRLGNDARKALHAELEQDGIALLKKGTLPGYVSAAATSQRGFKKAHELFERELQARISRQVSVPIGFVERLVIFWSNHFSMTINKNETVRGMVGQLERDVIRPNVLGRFEDMLLGVMRHPAMIAYLDNDDSIGPQSEVAKYWDAGFNENLARECMELHTVGSLGGYTEEDVTAFAKILTGWSYVRGWEADGRWNGGKPENRGQFIFRADWHQPGAIRLMGKTYPAKGMGQGEAVLKDLASSPKTAENIAFKLVRHFITDLPTPEMVRPLAAVFRKTGGDLLAVAHALIDLPAAFAAPMTKIRTPYELAIAQFRALGRLPKKDDRWVFTEPLRALRQLPFECPSPDGYSDDSATWMNPDAMTIRLDTSPMIVWVLLGQYEGDPVSLGKRIFGNALSATSLRRIAAAANPVAGLSTLFMTPEFQRR